MVDEDTTQQDMNMEEADTAGTLDQGALDATQSLIYRLSTQMDELKEKQKELNDMIKGIMDNDEKLSTAEDSATEAKKEAKSRKQELNETSEVKEIHMKIADVKEDIKMVQESLNTHLVNYFQMTGSTVVDQPDGTEREFRLSAKLKPAKRSD